jgi:hypothetical protein
MKCPIVLLLSGNADEFLEGLEAVLCEIISLDIENDGAEIENP